MAQNRTYAAAATPGTREDVRQLQHRRRVRRLEGFAPGSTFKPFTLLEWLKQGHSLNDQVNGTERTMNENNVRHVRRQGPERAVASSGTPRAAPA